MIYISQLGLQLAFHDFGMLGKIIAHADVDPSFQYLYNRSLYLWRGKMRYSGDTVDASEIPFPTTWPCKNLVNHYGINYLFPQLVFSPDF